VVFGLSFDILWLIKLRMFWKYWEILYNITKPSLYAVHHNLFFHELGNKSCGLYTVLTFVKDKCTLYCVIFCCWTELCDGVRQKHRVVHTQMYCTTELHTKWSVTLLFQCSTVFVTEYILLHMTKIVVKRIWIITHISYSAYVLWFNVRTNNY
jgi:hypothetical protein